MAKTNDPPRADDPLLTTAESAEYLGMKRGTLEVWRCTGRYGIPYIPRQIAFICRERNHQGLGNRLISPGAAASGSGSLRCRARLGGVLNFHYREAA
jgi:hypothetical protein